MTDLPWDTDGTETVHTVGTDMHARATSLAHAAMEAAADSDVPFAETDYGRACADYDRRLAEMRKGNAQRHLEANNARAAAAAAAKADRIAAHEARNAEARAGRLARAA